MQVGILTTDGGPHSATKWAAHTAGQIIEVAASASGEQALDGRRLELEVMDILEHHHGMVQEREKAKLASGEHDFDHVHDPNEHVDLTGIVEAICDAGKKTKWADHFSKPETVDYIRRVVGVDLATNMQIERFWYADRNPEDHKAKAYKSKYHGGV
jgi:hypothetical protein